MNVHPAKTQISLGICPVWSESSLCTQWVAKDPSFLHADSVGSDQTGRMPWLIWVFAGCTPFWCFCHEAAQFMMHNIFFYLMKMTAFHMQIILLANISKTLVGNDSDLTVNFIIWAATWQNQQNECAPSEDSAWASAQSDQSLRCLHEESLGPWLPTERTAKTLIRLGGYPGWS